jgi:hypothetical protein
MSTSMSNATQVAVAVAVDVELALAFAIVTERLSANGRELEHDGGHGSHVVRALASRVPLPAVGR